MSANVKSALGDGHPGRRTLKIARELIGDHLPTRNECQQGAFGMSANFKPVPPRLVPFLLELADAAMLQLGLTN